MSGTWERRDQCQNLRHGYRASPPTFTDYRDDTVGPVLGLVVGVACGVALWVLVAGLAWLLCVVT